MPEQIDENIADDLNKVAHDDANTNAIDRTNQDNEVIGEGENNLKRKCPLGLLVSDALDTESNDDNTPKRFKANENDNLVAIENPNNELLKTVNTQTGRQDGLYLDRSTQTESVKCEPASVVIKTEPLEIEHADAPANIKIEPLVAPANIKIEPPDEYEEQPYDYDDQPSCSNGSRNGIKVESRPSCRFGVRCYRRNPEHRHELAHPGDRDYKRPAHREIPGLPLCPYGFSCYRRNPIHFEEFNHPVEYIPNPPQILDCVIALELLFPDGYEVQDIQTVSRTINLHLNQNDNGNGNQNINANANGNANRNDNLNDSDDDLTDDSGDESDSDSSEAVSDEDYISDYDDCDKAEE